MNQFKLIGRFTCDLDLFFFLHINGSVYELAPPQKFATGLILDVLGIRIIVATLFGRGSIHKFPRGVGCTRLGFVITNKFPRCRFTALFQSKRGANQAAASNAHIVALASSWR